MDKTLKNKEFLQASAKSAARRHDIVEDLMEKGEATRTKKALENLHLAQDWGTMRAG
jgi:hypothetical protein